LYYCLITMPADNCEVTIDFYTYAIISRKMHSKKKLIKIMLITLTALIVREYE